MALHSRKIPLSRPSISALQVGQPTNIHNSLSPFLASFVFVLYVSGDVYAKRSRTSVLLKGSTCLRAKVDQV